MSCQSELEGEDAIMSQLSSIEEAVIAAINGYRSVSGHSKDEPMTMLGGCGGTPDTRYPTVAAPVNLVFGDDEDEAGGRLGFKQLPWGWDGWRVGGHFENGHGGLTNN